MIPLLLIFLAFFPQHLSALLIDSRFLFVNQLFIFPAAFIYFISICGSCCCCKPKRRYYPSCILILQHYTCAAGLLTAACLGFTGTKYLTFSFSRDRSGTSESITNIYDFIQDPFQQNSKNIMNFYGKVAKNDFYSISTTKSLKSLTNQYDSTFSDNNSIYRTSFNNIYFNPDASDYLKSSLQKMDESRNNILSEVSSFTDKYQKFSKSLQNTLSHINQNVLKPEEKSNKVIKIGLNYSLGNLYAFKNMFVPEFSYGLAAFIVLFTILYSVCFCCNNCCSRCCFCLYPLFAYIITAFSIYTCFYVRSRDYDIFKYFCGGGSSSSNYENSIIFSDISNSSFKTSLENTNNLKGILSEKDIKDIDELIQKINSRNVHENYVSIYKKYSPDPKYKNDLSKMVQIIEENDKNLKKMKDLFTNISDFSHSIYSVFGELFETSGQRIVHRNKAIKSDLLCGKLLNGTNFSVIAQFLLFACLLLMLISVCCRRRGMGGYVSKAKEFDRYVLDDEVDAVYNFNFNTNNNQNQSNNQQRNIEDLYPHLPLTLEESEVEEISEGIYRIVLGTRLSYHATTYEAASSIITDMSLRPGSKGMFGPGIYFAATMEIAKHKSRSYHVGAYVITKVDYGTALIRFAPDKNLTLEDLRRYGCDSVMGRSMDTADWEFVVYEPERTWPIRMIQLKERDDRIRQEEEFSEGEDDDNNEGGQTIKLGTAVFL